MIPTLGHPYNRTTNHHKTSMNEIMCSSICAEYPLPADRYKLKVLAFDGISRRTSSHLTNIDIKRENIKLVEKDEHTYEVHSRSGFRCMFGDAMKIFSEPNVDCKYDVIVLDAIGEPKYIFALMRLLVKNGYVKRNVIISSTFVRRGIKSSYAESFRSCKNMFERWSNTKLKEIAGKLAYGAPRNGQANMATYFWKLEPKKLKF